MSIKSKKWYINQIQCLERAAKNTGNLMDTRGFYGEYNSEAYWKHFRELCEINRPIQAECAKIYEKLNTLKAEYSLYYR